MCPDVGVRTGCQMSAVGWPVRMGGSAQIQDSETESGRMQGSHQEVRFRFRYERYDRRPYLVAVDLYILAEYGKKRESRRPTCLGSPQSSRPAYIFRLDTIEVPEARRRPSHVTKAYSLVIEQPLSLLGATFRGRCAPHLHLSLMTNSLPNKSVTITG